MTDEELAEMERLYIEGFYLDCADRVPFLVAEVRRLRGEVEKAEKLRNMALRWAEGERARVVAWLRAEADRLECKASRVAGSDPIWSAAMMGDAAHNRKLADAIEAGVHDKEAT